MVSCDVCGRPAIGMALIEGAKMNVCNGCSRYGRQIRPDKPKAQIGNVSGFKAPEFTLVEDFAERIKFAREDLGVTTEELAKKLGMRENDLKHFENGKTKPVEKDAQKLQNALGITLILKTEEKNESKEKETPKKEEKYAPPLGELVTIKTKKN